MADRLRFSTGNPWERSIGFSRAVKAGNIVYTAGTIASDEQGHIHGSNCYDQMCYVLDKLQGVLEEAGSSLEHVVRVVCYLTSLSDADEFQRAHSKYFGEIRPATTCLEVSDLFGDGSRVEIELTAVIPD